MPVEVSSKNTVALKTLTTPVATKETMKNGENCTDEDFNLQQDAISKLSEKSELAPEKDMSSETEEEILNKFDTSDTSQNDSITEDKLLNDSDDVETDTTKLNGVHDLAGDSEEVVAVKEVSNSDGSEARDDCNTKGNNVDVTIVQNGHSTEEHLDANDDKIKEQQDAELLKDQIMDTEDLLQIVEENKDTPNDAETDHEHETLEHDQDEDSDSCKHPDVETNDEIEDEFESEQMTAEPEAKDEAELEESDDVPVSESDTGISNENSNSGDKEDGLVIDEKSVELETDEKSAEIVEEADAIPVPGKEDCVMDADDTDTAKVTEEVQIKTTKRILSESESETESKKPKLAESIVSEEAKSGENLAKIKKITALNLFGDFMRTKSVTKLTRAHLEEFCLQKMCEAIFHKSEIGELRHQLGVQEQMAEMWRKEVVQLTKQARDLEIVNKRLLHEVRLKNERDKPLIPVKITRSVGLQVRCDSMMNMITPKRRISRPQPTSVTPIIAPKPATKQVITPLAKPTTIIPPNNNKAPKILNPKANALLTQALANSTSNISSSTSSAIIKSPIKTVTSTPLRVIPVKQPVGKNVLPKVTAVVTPTHSTKPVDKTFIDLTDEEEKKPQTVSLVASGTTTTTGVRVVKAPASVVTTSSSNPPRIMYVYNNQIHQGVLSADPSKPGGQKLMLKLNSNMMGQSNGVLATVPNGSLAVGGTTLRPGQPVRFTTPVTTVRNNLTSPKTVLKHPAPLPLPPAAQLSIAARKAIPPRPHLTIRRSSGGIVLSWKMPYNLDNYEAIASYQLYAYQETSAPPSSDMWRKVGDVKALALPMACTLTQFADGNKYHFAVRAVDVHKRMGAFSEPEQILL